MVLPSLGRMALGKHHPLPGSLPFWDLMRTVPAYNDDIYFGHVTWPISLFSPVVLKSWPAHTND